MASAPMASDVMGPYNDAGARDFLSKHAWPPGLQDTFINNLHKIPYRYFICDDSGSMCSPDGHKMVEKGGRRTFVDCSRWDELRQSLRFHASIAKYAAAPTEFRLLNGSAEPFIIGTKDPEDMRFNMFMTVLDESPSGSTPLCRHIHAVTAQIRAQADQLRAMNQKACIVIATDGESSDGDLATAMKPLESLPVWVVVRLCTDNDKIVNYWNEIDGQLELEMDVLDDICGEADEVFEGNPWLTYGEPLHKMREFGIPVRELDLLDEGLLSKEQLRAFCGIM